MISNISKNAVSNNGIAGAVNSVTLMVTPVTGGTNHDIMGLSRFRYLC